MELKRFSCQFSLKADADANSEMGMFAGYGSTFGNLDQGGDIVRAGAFTKSLAEWSMKGEMPFLCFLHDMSRPIGDWLEMKEDAKGLFLKGQLWVKGDRRIEDAVMAYNMLRGTGRKELSIGYYVKEYEEQESINGTIRILNEIDLVEVSIVPIAMNSAAKITQVKTLLDDEGKLLSKREVEKVLRDAGLSSRQAKAFIASGYDALGRDDQDDDHAELIATLSKFTQQLKGDTP